MVIQPSYEDARSFYDGVAAVMVNQKWGYIDRNGNQLVAAEFDEVSISRTAWDAWYVSSASGPRSAMWMRAENTCGFQLIDRRIDEESYNSVTSGAE